ncbi:hypothetical protein D3C86_927360 [compost metagenome]
MCGSCEDYSLSVTSFRVGLVSGLFILIEDAGCRNHGVEMFIEWQYRLVINEISLKYFLIPER